MNDIEIEIRSFIDENQYRSLSVFFTNKAGETKTESQETWYFDGPKDLRIQRSADSAKIWMKEGKIHDEAREEIEIKINRKDFEKTSDLFLSLGHKIQVKWFRDRKRFDWDGIKVCLDHTRGYGHIIELEKMGTPESQDEILDTLKSKLNELKISLTPRSDFEEKYEYYLKNWESLIGT